MMISYQELVRTFLSLFQNGATAFRAITYCGWQKLDNAVTALAKN
nr:hypothetical protein [Escherichia coli]